MSCNFRPAITPDSIVRLYPTEKILPLIEILVDDSTGLEKAVDSMQNDVFYRINANDVSRPGRIIPMGESWGREAEIRCPDRLKFSAMVAPEGSGGVTVKVVISQSDRIIAVHEFPIPGLAPANPGWNDFEIDLDALGNSAAEFRFECRSDASEQTKGQPGFP